ncbi:CU044_2847 family protein [Streptomyces sp. SD15]
MPYENEYATDTDRQSQAVVRTVEVDLAGGGRVEVRAVSGGGATDIASVPGSFEEAMDSLRGVARATLAAVRAAGPDEATVEFGMNVRAKTGQLMGFLVSADTGADLKVTMTWRKPDTPRNTAST